MATSNWTIPGSNPLAEGLRAAARFIDTDTPITILTEPGQTGERAFALGRAVFESNATRVVPFYAAYEAIEMVKHAIDAGEVGKMYGCFGSFRVARGTSGDDLKFSALLPILGTTLDLLSSPVTSVFAKRAALFAADDAWFVTLRLADETIVTLEALASCDPTGGRELLIEVTGSDRALRAEPFRQAVTVEPLGGPATVHTWLEDPMERFLSLLTQRVQQPQTNDIARLRAVWTAMLESADTGQRIDMRASD